MRQKIPLQPELFHRSDFLWLRAWFVEQFERWSCWDNRSPPLTPGSPNRNTSTRPRGQLAPCVNPATESLEVVVNILVAFPRHNVSCDIALELSILVFLTRSQALDELEQTRMMNIVQAQQTLVRGFCEIVGSRLPVQRTLMD